MKISFLNSAVIKYEETLNDLDRFVLNFIKILEKHTEYVIVSGYISLLFGRSRNTEDIDLFIQELSKEKLKLLYKNLERNGYWCLNTDDEEEIYSYLKDRLAVRFAIKPNLIPNFEIKFAIKSLDKEALKDTLKIITNEGNIIISSLERQIAYKKYYLKSDKDQEDAKYIESTFKENINKGKILLYKNIIENEMA